MSEPDAKKAAGAGGDLLTLSEVSKRTNISMPTLQRYKKLYQRRIPSVGKGRKQRYPEAALAVFAEIKNENVGRRGRPRKDAGAAKAKPGRKPKAAKAEGRGRKAAAKKSTRGGRKAAAPVAAAAGGDLLTLTEISKRTKISYPTLVRYVKLYLKQIPHEGSGRRRRFHPEAVEVFTRLRGESGRGRKPGRKAGAGRKAAVPAAAAGDATLDRRVQSLEKSYDSLEKQIRKLIKSLEKPLRVTVARGR